MRCRCCLFLVCSLINSVSLCSGQDIDLGTVTEKHQMIPMRDGKHLSAYLYFPAGEGPWPVLFEQRYADITGAGTRRPPQNWRRQVMLLRW